MENAVANSGRPHVAGMLRMAAMLLAVVMSGGCVTRPPVTDVYPYRLDQIQSGAHVTVLTRDGESIKMKVTAADAEKLAGVDRRFRAYEIHLDEMAGVTVASQNDTIVMLAWLAVVFATGL